MSWLVNSIANSLKLDDDDNDGGTAAIDDKRPLASDDQHRDLSPSDEDPDLRGVKEDLSELSKTLTRQFWGVASFLAPPPQVSDPDSRAEEIDQDGSDSDPDGVSGFRNDLSEIGGRFRAGISKLSGNKAVSGLSKVASSFLHFGSEASQSIEDYAQRGVVGVTEEVVAFARDIAMHPETWLDFPLPDEDEEEEEEEFDMSDAQQEHALAVERLAPTLAALRIELCPGYMSEGCFWKIYFVLVHPRLSRDDAVLLSSPQIMKARAMLTNDLKTRVKSKSYGVERDTAAEAASEQDLLVPSTTNPAPEPKDVSITQPENSRDTTNIQMDKHPVSTIESESPVVDKQMVVEVSGTKTDNAKPTHEHINITEKYEEDGDDWLKEEPSDIGGSGGNSIPLDDNEDVSFSDLEDDDDDTPIKKVVYPSESTKAHHPTPEAEESDGWLDTRDLDVA